ncbi:Ketosteroid isomerase-related protein (plasmid) [Variovorax sp. PBS-H4]|uniref:nuclear transport factor 2 family protein n=1 Tax=Variovorax sp. PBS-H4 TaxID=434008 RepID=UPI001319A76D|nr:nuclear transport factor 2 family protein [Variovorax sp. PBS-H4]VTU41431.1 Ketosteroid isomerase-related protein [Variovorax sp. PBS-H4]
MSASVQGDAGTVLRDWFSRLSDAGFSSDLFLAGLAEDVTWTATGDSPVSGTFRGLAAYVEGVYRPLAARLARWPEPVVERITAEGQWGVVEFRGVGGIGHNGCDYSMRYCWSMRVENGLVQEVVGYYDQSKVHELFADPS